VNELSNDIEDLERQTEELREEKSKFEG